MAFKCMNKSLAYISMKFKKRSVAHYRYTNTRGSNNLEIPGYHDIAAGQRTFRNTAT